MSLVAYCHLRKEERRFRLENIYNPVVYSPYKKKINNISDYLIYKNVKHCYVAWVISSHFDLITMLIYLGRVDGKLTVNVRRLICGLLVPQMPGVLIDESELLDIIEYNFEGDVSYVEFSRSLTKAVKFERNIDIYWLCERVLLYRGLTSVHKIALLWKINSAITMHNSGFFNKVRLFLFYKKPVYGAIRTSLIGRLYQFISPKIP